MGTLHYGAPPASYDLDDRTLAHVELVVVAKLRRNESFALTLDGKGGKRSTLWINSAATLRFDFDGSEHEINRRWLDELLDSANTTAGMRVVPEPTAAETASAAPAA